jgi:uncharacterized protein YndB with AHSA1/START domain
MPDERELVLTRVYPIPPEKLFRLWTDPNHFTRWFGPRIFTYPACEIDARPGGEWFIVFRAPDGVEFINKGVYTNFEPPHRLAFSGTVLDSVGTILLEGTTTVTFEPEGVGTKQTIQTKAIARVANANPMLAGMEPGWIESLDRLNELCNAQ